MKPPWFLCFWDDFRVMLRAWRGLAAFRAGCLRGTDLEVTYRSYLEVAYRLAAAKIGVPLDCRPQMARCILSVGTTGSLGMICGLVNVVAARFVHPKVFRTLWPRSLPCSTLLLDQRWALWSLPTRAVL